MLWWLFWASFAETLVVPIPIELVLIPFMLANRHRLWLTAGVVTAGCLCASVLGYGLGAWFFETLGRHLVDWFQWSDALARFRAQFELYGFWAIVAVGVTPVPFQVAMLAAGVAGYALTAFVLAALLARGLRYFGLALLVHAFGDRAESLWRRHRGRAALVAIDHCPKSPAAAPSTISTAAW